MNSVVGEVTIRKTGYQTKAVKGATGYTLPTRPEDALYSLKQEEKEISNQIMLIPFPEIRNLIITFLKPYPPISKDHSELLLSEYQQNMQLAAIDQQITQKIRIGYHQRSKLQKLHRCFKKASQLKTSITNLKQSIRMAKSTNVNQKIQEIKSREPIQQKRTTAIMDQLLGHQEIYTSLNEDYINLDSQFAEVKEYCAEIQKVGPIIWRVEGVGETQEEIGAKNYIEYMESEIVGLLQPLSGFVHSSEAWLELFRNKVKSRSWTEDEECVQEVRTYQRKLKDFIERYSEIELATKELYQKLRELPKLQQHIMRNLSSESTQNMKEYESFVETFTDIKEIATAKHQWEEFERIISDEERYLSDHMKMNCGLVVFYKPTRAFEEFAGAVVNRRYVEQIFAKRLAPIRNAIKYINEEYGVLYKKACEENSSRSKLRKIEVRRVLDKFKEDWQNLDGLQKYKNDQNLSEKVHSEYVMHLIESLNRLMGLASE